MNQPSNNNIPKHVAIIMDGNGRWAQNRDLPRKAGHQSGVDSARRIVRYAAEHGVEVLTLFVFSSENWRRPTDEIETIFGLFLSVLQNEINELVDKNVQLRVIGNQQRFSKDLQQQIAYTEELTKNNTGLTLIIAADYGGQWDITQAVQKIVKKVIAGELDLAAVTPENFGNYLELADLPYPDLFIRTSGEQRISNFYLWQLAYTELYFPSAHWPDFDEKEFAKALDYYATRQRRFGYTSDQVITQNNREK